MTIEGETVGKYTTVCTGCGKSLYPQVCRSGAGYYVGFFCLNCGPYSRESGYYRTAEEAQAALKSGAFGR